MQTLTIERTKPGLHVKTQSGGNMVRETGLTHDVDSVLLTFIAGKPTTLWLGWKPVNVSEGTVEVTMSVTGTARSETIQIPVHQFDEWGDGSEAVSIGFPAGADVILQDVRFIGYSPL